MNENLSAETLVGDTHVASSNGGTTVESPQLSLADLNKHLGSDFKDMPTALKGLKDTKDFVGKRKEDIVTEVKNSFVNTPELASKSDIQSLKDELFLSQNPQYKDYVPLLKKIGGDLAEAVNAPEFKSLIEKAQVADEVAQNKSVVSSNSRLSQSKTASDQAVTVANARGTTIEDVATVLARAVNEEFYQR